MLRMWVLYALFVGIALSCAGLFFYNIFSSDSGYHLDNLERQLQKDSQYSLFITDLVRTDNAFRYDTPIDTTEGRFALHARTATFDLLVSTSDASIVEDSLLSWTLVLQVAAVVFLSIILILDIVLMVNMFRCIRQGRLFRRSSMRLLSVIGLGIILLTLSLDASTYLERLLAYRLLQGTDWEPLHGFTLHVTRLLCGIILLFVAELLRVGYSIQEDQDLTI